MITKSTDQRKSYLRKVFALPAMALIVFFIACRSKDVVNSGENAKSTVAKASSNSAVKKRGFYSAQTFPDLSFSKSMIRLNGKVTDSISALSLDANSVEKITVLDKVTGMNKYGKDGENGVIEIIRKAEKSARNGILKFDGTFSKGTFYGTIDIPQNKKYTLGQILYGNIYSNEEKNRVKSTRKDKEDIKVTNLKLEKITSGIRSKEGVSIVRADTMFVPNDRSREEFRGNVVLKKADGLPVPLIFLNGKKTDSNILDHLDNKTIQSVIITERKFAIEKFGDEGKNGVYEIFTKSANE